MIMKKENFSEQTPNDSSEKNILFIVNMDGIYQAMNKEHFELIPIHSIECIQAPSYPLGAFTYQIGSGCSQSLLCSALNTVGNSSISICFASSENGRNTCSEIECPFS